MHFSGPIPICVGLEWPIQIFGQYSRPIFKIVLFNGNEEKRKRKKYLFLSEYKVLKSICH